MLPKRWKSLRLPNNRYFRANSFPGNCLAKRFISNPIKPTDTAETGNSVFVDDHVDRLFGSLKSIQNCLFGFSEIGLGQGNLLVCLTKRLVSGDS